MIQLILFYIRFLFPCIMDIERLRFIEVIKNYFDFMNTFQHLFHMIIADQIRKYPMILRVIRQFRNDFINFTGKMILCSCVKRSVGALLNCFYFCLDNA